MYSIFKDSKKFDVPWCQIIWIIFLWLGKVFFCTPTLLNQEFFELIDAATEWIGRGSILYGLSSNIFLLFQIFKLLTSFWRGGLLHKKIEPCCNHVTHMYLKSWCLIAFVNDCMLFWILVFCLEEEWIEYVCLEPRIIFWTSFNMHHGRTFTSWL